MRLDASIYKYTYDPTWQGKTIYFKFQAVNNFGNNPQPLSNLSAVAFTILPTNSGQVSASSGLMLYQISPRFCLVQSEPYTIAIDGLVEVNFGSGVVVSYNGGPMTIPVPTAPIWYYVCIEDPNITGDVSVYTTTLTHDCNTSPTHVGQIGWTFIGAIQAVPSATWALGLGNNIIAGGWPNPLSVMTNTPTTWTRPVPITAHHAPSTPST